METQAEKPMTKGELDDKFVVLAVDEDGWGIIQFEAPRMGLTIYTGRRNPRTGRFHKSPIPRDVFFDLAKKAEERREAFTRHC